MVLRFSLLLSLVLSLSACQADAPKLDKSVIVDCSAFAFTTEILELESHTECGHPDADGILHIDAETMKYFTEADFQYDYGGWGQIGLRCSRFRLSDGTGGFGYFAEDGRARISNFPYDNNCQPFRNDVAISYVDGKAAFFDKDLRLVEQTDYALANPFFKYLAKVCRELPNKEYHGEHFNWVGGQCGYIDTDFNEVVPIKYAYEETRRLTGGKYDGVELNKWDKPVLDLLIANLKENQSPVEAVFRPMGCSLDYCSEVEKKSFNLPPDLDEANTWIKVIRFRLEDQTVWEGQVLSDRQRNLTLHNLFAIEALPHR